MWLGTRVAAWTKYPDMILAVVVVVVVGPGLDLGRPPSCDATPPRLPDCQTAGSLHQLIPSDSNQNQK